MADFYQTGVVTTLHRLGETRLDRLEAELVEFTETRPLTLVIPALASEMDGPALPHIVEVLAGGPVLRDAAAADRHLVARRTAGAGAVPPSRRGADLHRHPGQRPHRLARAGLCARRPQLAQHRAARRRHRDLPARPAGTAMLPGGQPVAGLRVRQGLLRAHHRSDVWPGGAAVRHTTDPHAVQVCGLPPAAGVP